MCVPCQERERVSEGDRERTVFCQEIPSERLRGESLLWHFQLDAEAEAVGGGGDEGEVGPERERERDEGEGGRGKMKPKLLARREASGPRDDAQSADGKA